MLGRTVVGADGREWRVGRRWLPWKPRKRGKLGDAGDVFQGIDVEPPPEERAVAVPG